MPKLSRASAAAFASAILVGSNPAPAEPARLEARARALLGDASELAARGTDRFGDGDVIVHFAQTHRGLPVAFRGAALRIDAAGRPVARSVAVERALPSSIDPAVPRSAAASIAAPFSPLRPSAGDAHLVVWPTRDRGARLAWAVVPHVPAGLPFAPRVIVDAQTGELLEARDTATFANVRTFAQNPVKTPAASVLPLPLAPTGTTLDHPLLSATNCVDNKTVKPVDFYGFDLSVHVCDLQQVATADESGDFLFEPADEPGSAASKSDPFSEASIFFHASTAYTFFRTLAGDPEAQVVVDKPLKLVANLQIPAGVSSGDLAAAGNPDTALEPFQNAFFSPAGGGLGALFQQLYGFDAGALWFGQGPQRDYAYDGDVVYHEFTHAVVDDSLKLQAWHVDARGAVDAPAAMNEGLADYFSSAITGDPDVGEYASKDLGGGADVIRSLVNGDRCPDAVIGEPHFDSTLFSGALWDARASLAAADRPKFDAALYKAMRTSAGEGDLGYDDAAKSFLATLRTDLPAGADALEESMTGRGVLPACDRIVTFAEKAITSPEPRIGFVAPGRQSVSVRGMAPGIMQIEAKIPAGATSVSLTFTARDAGGGAAGLLGGGGTPFTPVVLAKIGQPITWDAKAKKAHDAELQADAEGTESRSATLDLPEGASGSIYLQIANTGTSDGTYDAVELAFETPPPPAVEAPDETPSTTGPESEDSGCACRGAPTARGDGTPAGLLGVALAGFVVRLRRGRGRSSFTA